MYIVVHQAQDIRDVFGCRIMAETGAELCICYGDDVNVVKDVIPR
jgi:hypothetical protein